MVAFDSPLPEAREASKVVIDELAARADPGLNVTTGARFFGWVIGGSHPVGSVISWLIDDADGKATAEAIIAAWRGVRETSQD